MATSRLKGRNGQIWHDYCRGMTQEALGEKHKLSQTRISEIIAEVRDSIPQQTREELIQREIEYLYRVAAEVMELWDMQAPPVTVGKDGDVLYDPETNELMRDHSGRLAALSAGLAVRKRIAEMLGLNAPTKIQTDGTVKYTVEGIDVEALR
jgi:hypothetical protein